MIRAVTDDLIAKYDRPGPRYTSYPTAPTWRDDFDAQAYRTAVTGSNRTGRPLSLYVHLPFCEEQCTFCGCNVVITKRKEVVEPYLGDLEREIALLSSWIDDTRPVVQLHWGGGTPTYLTSPQIQRLADAIQRHFHFAPDAELGVEVDPRVTTPEQLAVLRECGFNRISMGVQDFTPAVQQAIHRMQPLDMTAKLIACCRQLHFLSVNIDLIYGLPHQTLATFAETLAAVVELQPDRVALYNFAYVPWLKPHQRSINVTWLPAPRTKLGLFRQGIETFTGAGYQFIGMDHFARPTDELAVALAARTLWRNFQGYTTKAGTDLIAFGMTAISDIDGHYAQNTKTIPAYRRALATQMSPTERGMKLTPDDQLRRTVIRELLCNDYCAKSVIAAEFAIDFDTYFQKELKALQLMHDDGLVGITREAIQVTPLGRLFVRNVAMAFDRYLTVNGAERPLYSRTI